MSSKKSSFSSRDCTPTRNRGLLVPRSLPSPAELSQAFAVDHHISLVETYARVIDAPDAELADAVFRVGGQTFGGLRRVLALRCPSLRQALLGDSAEAVDCPLCLPEFDAMPRAFRQFLFYLHIGQCSLDNVSDVLGLYEVAEHFGMTELQEACADYLDKAEIVDEVIADLSNFAAKHGVAGLTERVVNHIADHADIALGDSVRSAQLPPTLLRYFFQSSDIGICEVTLIRILLELSPAQRQPLLAHVRLPRVGALEMMRLVVPSGLFDHSACLAAMAYRENPQSVDLPEEARLPRVQSVQGAGKLLPRRGSKASREPSGPWGRQYLHFASSESRDDSGSAEGAEAAEGRETPEPSPEDHSSVPVLPAAAREEDNEPCPTLAAAEPLAAAAELPAGGTPACLADVVVEECSPACRLEEDWGPPESEPCWRSGAG